MLGCAGVALTGKAMRKAAMSREMKRWRKSRYCTFLDKNQVVNKVELQYYDYSNAVLGVAFLGFMHVCP